MIINSGAGCKANVDRRAHKQTSVGLQVCASDSSVPVPPTHNIRSTCAPMGQERNEMVPCDRRRGVGHQSVDPNAVQFHSEIVSREALMAGASSKPTWWRTPVLVGWHRATPSGTVVVTAALLGPGWRPAQSQSQPPLESGNRYKTELCRSFEEAGFCKYGCKCQFAHGASELRTLARHPKYKTQLCRTFHSSGLCPYGLRCHFIHNGDESGDKCLL